MTLAAMPAAVAINAPASVQRVFLSGVCGKLGIPASIVPLIIH